MSSRIASTAAGGAATKFKPKRPPKKSLQATAAVEAPANNDPSALAAEQSTAVSTSQFNEAATNVALSQNDTPDLHYGTTTQDSLVDSTQATPLSPPSIPTTSIIKPASAISPPSVPFPITHSIQSTAVSAPTDPPSATPIAISTPSSISASYTRRSYTSAAVAARPPIAPSDPTLSTDTPSTSAAPPPVVKKFKPVRSVNVAGPATAPATTKPAKAAKAAGSKVTPSHDVSVPSVLTMTAAAPAQEPTAPVIEAGPVHGDAAPTSAESAEPSKPAKAGQRNGTVAQNIPVPSASQATTTAPVSEPPSPAIEAAAAGVEAASTYEEATSANGQALPAIVEEAPAPATEAETAATATASTASEYPTSAPSIADNDATEPVVSATPATAAPAEQATKATPKRKSRAIASASSATLGASASNTALSAATDGKAKAKAKAKGKGKAVEDESTTVEGTAPQVKTVPKKRKAASSIATAGDADVPVEGAASSSVFTAAAPTPTKRKRPTKKVAVRSAPKDTPVVASEPSHSNIPVHTAEEEEAQIMDLIRSHLSPSVQPESAPPGREVEQEQQPTHIDPLLLLNNASSVAMSRTSSGASGRLVSAPAVEVEVPVAPPVPTVEEETGPRRRSLRTRKPAPTAQAAVAETVAANDNTARDIDEHPKRRRRRAAKIAGQAYDTAAEETEGDIAVPTLESLAAEEAEQDDVESGSDTAFVQPVETTKGKGRAKRKRDTTKATSTAKGAVKRRRKTEKLATQPVRTSNRSDIETDAEGPRENADEEVAGLPNVFPNDEVDMSAYINENGDAQEALDMSQTVHDDPNAPLDPTATTMGSLTRDTGRGRISSWMKRKIETQFDKRERMRRARERQKFKIKLEKEGLSAQAIFERVAEEFPDDQQAFNPEPTPAPIEADEQQADDEDEGEGDGADKEDNGSEHVRSDKDADERAEGTPAPSVAPTDEGLYESQYATQMRMVDGELVVDEASTVIQRPQAREQYDVVEDRLNERRVTSATYAKWKPGRRWTLAETKMFYEGLRQFGTDFELISRMFNNRSRRQIKLKWVREERDFPEVVTEALKRKKPVNIDYYQRMTQRDLNGPIPADPMTKYYEGLPTKEEKVKLESNRIPDVIEEAEEQDLHEEVDQNYQNEEYQEVDDKGGKTTLFRQDSQEPLDDAEEAQEEQEEQIPDIDVHDAGMEHARSPSIDRRSASPLPPAPFDFASLGAPSISVGSRS